MTSFTSLNNKFKNKTYALGVLPMSYQVQYTVCEERNTALQTYSASLPPHCLLLVGLFPHRFILLSRSSYI